MSYKLKDVFLENTSETTLEENFISNILGALKDVTTGVFSNLSSKYQVAQIEKTINFLKQLRSYGIKRFYGHNINVPIRELERQKRNLLQPYDDDDDDFDLVKYFRNLEKQTKQKNPAKQPQRRTLPKRTMENKYSLKSIFFEQEETEKVVPLVQSSDEELYNAKKTQTVEPETPFEKAADNDPGLSDEDILSGLRDDVANYGDFDPALGDEQ